MCFSMISVCNRWDETSDEDSASMEPSNSEDEQYSDHNRRPRRQAAVATKKKQAKRNAARRKNYSSGDNSESDDEQKRCVCYVFIYCNRQICGVKFSSVSTTLRLCYLNFK